MRTLWQFDTAVWFQSLVESDGSYTLERYYKRPTPEEIRAAVARTSAQPNRCWVSPEAIDELGTCTYRLASEKLLFTMVADPVSDVDEVAGLLGALGTELARFHQEGPANSSDESSHQQDRQAAMTGAGVPGSGIRLFDYLREDRDDSAGFLLREIGSERREYLRKLSETAVSPAPDSVCTHGNMSLGNIFVTDDGEFQIPTGPDSGVAAREFDVGWIVGELTESEHLLMLQQRPTDVVGIAGASFVHGYEAAYGASVDMSLLMSYAMLRTTLHYLDYALTYPEIEPEPESLRFLCWLVDRARDRVPA